MNTIKTILLILLLGIVSFSSFGQIEIINHTEIDTDASKGTDYSDYNVITLGEEGMVVSLTHFVSWKKQLIFSKYDTTFQKLWEFKYEVKGEDKIVDYDIKNGSVYYLLDKQRFEYDILQIDLETGVTKVISYQKILKATYSQILAGGDVILLGGEADNSSVVLHLNTKTGRQQILPSLVQKSSHLAALEIDEEKNTILAVVAGNYSSFKHAFFYFYDLNGKLRYNVSIPDNKDYNLRTFRPIIVGENELLVLGTYSSVRWKRPQGVFSLQIKDKKQKGFRFYDFSYLNNFFNHLDENKKEKMLAKVKKLRRKGEYKRYSNEYFVSPLRIENNRIYLALEGYNPVYENNNNSLPNGMVGNPYFGRSSIYRNRLNRGIWQSNPNSTTLVTYKYKQAVVCAFDDTGKLLWDNQFDFDSFETLKVFPFFAYSIQNDTASYFRIDEERLFYKQSSKSTEQSFITESEVPRRDSLDRVLNRSEEMVLHWHDDVYLISGYQVVRNDLRTNSRRKVFYFTRLKYPISASEVDKKEEENTNNKEASTKER